MFTLASATLFAFASVSMLKHPWAWVSLKSYSPNRTISVRDDSEKMFTCFEAAKYLLFRPLYWLTVERTSCPLFPLRYGIDLLNKCDEYLGDGMQKNTMRDRAISQSPSRNIHVFILYIYSFSWLVAFEIFLPHSAFLFCISNN